MKIGKKEISDKTLTNILYGAAVVAVVAVIALTIFTVAYDRSDRDRDDAPEKITTTTKKSPTTDGQNPVIETPDTGKDDQPGEKEDEQTTVIVNEPLEFVLPCSGLPSKTFDIQNLSYSLTMNDYRTHSGLDIEADIGSAVCAAESGKISAVYRDHMMGYTVEIDHGDGFVSVYKNLSDEMPEGIEVGKEVKKGDVIGAVGTSALIEQAEEPHLHFELKVNGTGVDPLTYITLTEETMSEAYED